MNHNAIYVQLVEHAKERNLTRKDCYVEEHHIIPLAEGGPDCKSNLVAFTAREHYIAHLLLAKIYNDAAMYSAVTYMRTGKHKNRKFKFNSHLYEKMRIECSIKRKSFRHTEETKRKISMSLKGRPCHNKGKPAWNRGKQHSIETKKKISERSFMTSAGRHWYNNGVKDVFVKECPEGFTAGRLSSAGKNNGMYGHNHSDEARKKMSLQRKGRKLSKEAREAMRLERTGKHWFTNGIDNRFAKECPNGYQLGRTF